ncbi:amino acid permease [Candidatus Aerophobetes bacterium]|uniref:Amino acid permease n=1 Tax=Aerophobetes bacterium TaxID=2030807 RepID=A0A2A4YCV7_UNCAE|nr:MAG: amino acid permease [Candidatus Aerophobetes bacterium]
MSTKISKKSLSVFVLAMINVAAICSIKNWPITAEYGFSSLFYYLIAAVGFFIPVALVSAELASTYPKNGGVYSWVKEAMGHKMGFLAIWLQWIENVAWYPTVLSFVAATLAYTISPSLALNNVYSFFSILILYWGATFLNFRGIKTSGLVSTSAVILGTLIPGALIIILGVVWYSTGQPSQIVITAQSFVPSLNSPHKLSILVGVVLGFAGLEMTAVHVRDVENPRKNYPRAILLSAILIIGLSVLGTLAIAMVIPKENISLVSGGMDAIAYFLKSYGLSWLTPIVSILIAFGAFGAVVAWIIGPSRGLLTAAQDGDLPPILHKTNKNNMPTSMLVMQGFIVSALASVFLFMPTVSSSFWILIALAAMLYSVMYAIMFITAIVLRHKHPNIERPFSVPGGKIGMWIIAGIGCIMSTFTIIIGFFPPSNIVLTNFVFYETFLIVGMVVFIAIPFLILMFKKPSWNLDKALATEDEPL